MTTTSARRLNHLCQHLSPVPTAASASEIQDILKALGPDPISPTPRKMFYQNLSHLDKSFPSGDLPSLKERGAKASPELVGRIQNLAPAPEGKEESDGHLQVVKALLLLAADALDEAHSVSVNVSIRKKFKGSSAPRDATWVHAMTHRVEGEFKGAEDVQRVPGGSMGWDSTRLILKSIDNKPHALYPRVLEEAKKFAEGTKSESILSHMRFHDGGWNWAEFVHFLKDSSIAKDTEALQFCRNVMNAEWRLLLEDSLSKAKLATTTA